MNIFFDVDYTILAVDSSIRPGTKEVFERLVADGHRVFVWSGVGIRTDEVRQHDLQDHVTDIFQKPLEDFEAGLSKFGVTVRPDFVIDDYPEIVGAFGGVLIRPYYFSAADDEEMERVYRIVGDVVAKGHSEDIAYRRRTDSTASTTE